jgi:hypothetical protein
LPVISLQFLLRFSALLNEGSTRFPIALSKMEILGKTVIVSHPAQCRDVKEKRHGF